MEEAPKRGREDVEEAVDGSAKRARVDVVASAESSSTVSNAGAAAAPLAAPAAAAAAVAHAKRLSNYGNADGKLCIRNAGKWSDKKEWVKKLNALAITFRNVIKQRGSTFAMVSFSSDAEREAGRVQLKAASYKGKPLDVRDAKAKKVKKRANTWDMKRDAGAKRSRGGGAVAAVDAKPRTIHDAVTPLHNVPYATQLEQKQEAMQSTLVKITEGMRNAIAEWVIRKAANKNAKKGGGGGYQRKPGKKALRTADISKVAPRWLMERVKRVPYVAPVKGDTTPMPKPPPYSERMMCCPLEGGVMPSPFTEFYRTKCTFTVGRDAAGELCVGFRLSSFAEGITLARAKGCRNVPLGVVAIAAAFEAHATETGLLPCVVSGHAGDGGADAARQGVWRRLTVRACLHTGEMMLIVETTSESHGGEGDSVLELGPSHARGKQLRRDLVEWFRTLPSAAGLRPLALVLVQFDGCSIPDSDHPFEVLHGSMVQEQILGVPFEISPTAFFQANSRGAEVLFSLVAEWVDAGSAERDRVLLDICCGTGTIGICLLAALRERWQRAAARGVSKHPSAEVIGVDMCAAAVADANRNAQRCGFGDVAKFYSGKAEHVLKDLLKSRFGKGGQPLLPPPPPLVVAVGAAATAWTRHLYPGVVAATGLSSLIGKTPSSGTGTASSSIAVGTHGARAIAFGPSYRMLTYRTAHVPFALAVHAGAAAGSSSSSSSSSSASAPSYAPLCVGIVDPPRSGLHPAVVRAIRDCKSITRLVYVSCNPTGSFIKDAVE